MVAVDDEGKPKPVPPLRPGTEEERLRQRQAAVRKQLRQELEQRYQSVKAQG